MIRDFDELFLKVALHNRLLTEEQVSTCRSTLHEASGEPVAALAQNLGFLTRDKAVKVVDAINKKFPGKHPPLTESPAPAAPRPAPRSAARRARPVPTVPTPKATAGSRKKTLWIAAGLLLLLGGGVLFFVRNRGTEPTPTQEPETALPPPPTAPPTPPPATEKKTEEIAPPPAVVAEAKPEAPPLPATQEASPDEEFRARMSERKKAAQERLEEARRELAEEKKAEEEKAQALRARLSGKPVTLKLRSGETVTGAVLRAYTFADIEVEASGQKIQSLPWDSLAPASILATTDILFDPSDAAQQFERGRLLIARTLWKEAKEALDRAVKLDVEYESKAADALEVIERILSGQGSFQAAVRRIGSNGLSLTYDFKNPQQREDFLGELKHSEGALTLEDLDGQAAMALRDLDFIFETELESKITAETPVTIGLFSGERGGYQVELGFSGCSVYKIDPKAESEEKGRKLLVKNDKASLVKGKATDLFISSRSRKTKVFLDRKEILSADDPPTTADDPPPRGSLYFSLKKGRATFSAPFVVRGLLERRDIDKRFAEGEVLARRALDPDLAEVEELRNTDMGRRFLGTRGGVKLSADDPHFVLRMDIQELASYDDLKRKLMNFLQNGHDEDDETKKALDALLTKYETVPALHYLRALYHNEIQDMPAAKAALKRALELFPEFTEAIALEARILDQWDEDRPAAVAAARRALESQPDYAPAYVTIATARFSEDPSKVAECLEDLRLAQKLDPSNREVPSFLRILKYEARGPRDLGCRFTYESPHYIVMTDISDEAAKLYAGRLEAAYGHYCNVFKNFYSERPFPKPRVAIFNTAENYYTYFELISEDRGNYTLGVFRQQFNELVLFEDVDLEETLDTMYHEAFHHFMSLIVKGTPPYWYNEGIAEYIAGITVEERAGKMQITKTGQIKKGRLRDLQVGMHLNFLDSFKKLMTQPPREFYSGHVGLKYAQAWSMLHFFYEFEKGKHRPLIEKYLTAIKEGKPIQEAYEVAFQEKADDLEKEWRAYIKTLKAE